jgi:hypothetical protein
METYIFIMKLLYILIGLIALAFLVVQFFAIRAQHNIETYPYTVIKEYPSFEIRQYQPGLFTSVRLPGNSFKEVSGKGFSVLAGYIFGGNDKNEKIAMTSPVGMSLEDSMTMMFLVPKKFKREALPIPNQEGIEFKEIPAKKMAAIRFGGWASDEKIARYRKKLTKAMAAEGIAHSGKFHFFGYNAPYEVFLRRNEVVVELK